MEDLARTTYTKYYVRKLPFTNYPIYRKSYYYCKFFNGSLFSSIYLL